MIGACEHIADYARAGEWTEAAKRWCERQTIKGFPGMCRVYRAEIMRLRGDWVAAHEDAQVACAELREWSPVVAGAAFYEVGEIRLRTGDLEGAEQAFRQAHELDRDPVPGLALLELARGNVDAADDYARRTEKHAAWLGLRLPTSIGMRARAAVLLQQGRPADAARLANEAATVAAEVGARFYVAFSLALAGRALAAAGDRTEAIAVLREAERELDESGSLRGRDEMRRELRKLGARAEPRGPATAGDSGLATLTRREREIADLVTDRRTNREIAGALFLSEKTVESHMRNIFAKLGAGSRVEVARVVERERHAPTT
jgi:DNA-binding CsgD family transcriptional regulator